MPNPAAETVRPSRERVRLKAFEVEQLPDRHCAARVAVAWQPTRVALAWQPGSDFVGTAEGADSPQGRLRCVAEATARALQRATQNKVQLRVLAIKAVEEFGLDAVLVVVSFEALGLVEQLVGSCLIKEQSSRAACLAVLNAANRRLGLTAAIATA